MPKELLDINSKKFIGKRLGSLYKRHAFSRKSFVLFLENKDGSERRRLGSDPNLSLIIMKNAGYSQYPIASISKYYDEFHVVINPPEEE